MFEATLSMLPDIQFPLPSLRPDISKSDDNDVMNVKSHIPVHIPLPPFSHIPPPSIRGSDRWPLSLDAQSFPTHDTPGLAEILIWVHSFLDPNDRAVTHCISKSFRLGPTFGTLWFPRPWSPNRRRR